MVFRLWNILVLITLVVLASRGPAYASGAYSLSDGDDMVGQMRSFTVIGDETLLEIARLYNLGYNEIIAANPDIDPWLPGEGTDLVLPTRWVLPDSARKGIVINLAEMRLYHFINIDGRRMVRTYPIGVGAEGITTPTGTFRIGVKIKNPTWYVPKSIQKERPEEPAIVPPGPDNPLGGYAMNLKGTKYFIHGTNEPYGIGRRVSHGCLRMYPEDIEILFRSVEPGTLVNIIYQPVKIGEHDGKLFVEVHGDYLGRERNLYREALKVMRRRHLLEGVDVKSLWQAVNEQKGLPVILLVGDEPFVDSVITQKETPGPGDEHVDQGF